MTTDTLSLLHDDDRFLTTKEVAQVLDISVLTLKRLHHTEGMPALPYLCMSTRKLRYRVGDINAYLKACTTA